jgi:hypothetical protein
MLFRRAVSGLDGGLAPRTPPGRTRRARRERGPAVDLGGFQRVCLGRLYFKVPGGVQVGQHFLVIKFATSELQVPFRTLSKEDEKLFSKKWNDIKKEHEAALKQ